MVTHSNVLASKTDIQLLNGILSLYGTCVYLCTWDLKRNTQVLPQAQSHWVRINLLPAPKTPAKVQNEKGYNEMYECTV